MKSFRDKDQHRFSVSNELEGEVINEKQQSPKNHVDKHTDLCGSAQPLSSIELLERFHTRLVKTQAPTITNHPRFKLGH